MTDVENMELTEVGEVTQEQFDALTAASQLGHPIGTDLFGGFDEADEDEDEQTEAERQALLQIKTLVRVFDDSQPLKVAYIRHGVAKEMEPFMNVVIDSQTAKFKGRNAAGAYSQALIEAKETELKEQYMLLDIDPSVEEREDPKLFDEHYRSLVCEK